MDSFDPEKLLNNLPIAWEIDVQYRTNPGTIVGCDFAGTVAKVGRNVTSLSLGDHVAGFTQGSTWKDIGAFAEYTKTPGDLVWKVPPGSLTSEQAATFGCACVTFICTTSHRRISR